MAGKISHKAALARILAAPYWPRVDMSPEEREAYLEDRTRRYHNQVWNKTDDPDEIAGVRKMIENRDNEFRKEAAAVPSIFLPKEKTLKGIKFYTNGKDAKGDPTLDPYYGDGTDIIPEHAKQKFGQEYTYAQPTKEQYMTKLTNAAMKGKLGFSVYGLPESLGYATQRELEQIPIEQRGYSVIGLAKDKPLYADYRNLRERIKYMLEDAASSEGTLAKVEMPSENVIDNSVGIAAHAPNMWGSRRKPTYKTDVRNPYVPHYDKDRDFVEEWQTTKIKPTEDLTTDKMHITIPDYNVFGDNKETKLRLRADGYSPSDIQDIMAALDRGGGAGDIIPSSSYADSIANKFLARPEDHVSDERLKGIKFYRGTEDALTPFYGEVNNDNDVHEVGKTVEYLNEGHGTDDMPQQADDNVKRGFSTIGLAKNGEPLHVDYKNLIRTLRGMGRIGGTHVAEVEGSVIDNAAIPEGYDKHRDTAAEWQMPVLTPTKIINKEQQYLDIPDWAERLSKLTKEHKIQLRKQGISPSDINDIINTKKSENDFKGKNAFADWRMAQSRIRTKWADDIAKEFIRSPDTHVSDRHMKTIIGAVYHGR